LLSLSEVKRVVSECIALGVTNVTFTGGEPLLEPGLEECLTIVPADKAVAQVFSNAVGLNPERVASLKEAGVSGIHISLDSPEAEEHDRWRGRRGLFDLVERGVKNALGEGLLVGLSTYATNESIVSKKLSRVAALAAGWGVHEVSVFDVIPTGRLLRSPDVMITEKNRGRLLREARLLNRQNRGRPRIVTQSWTNSGKGFARFLGCLAAIYQFHITAFGDFMPCDFTPLSFGNIRDDSVADLWQRLVHHPAFCRRSHGCRMQDSGFRKTYIDSIPHDADMPYNINGR
jgi:MoaA/NifB/PqqE/SkfB family radical SAM enzyme